MESEKNMEHKIVFATSNAGKMREIREILKDLGAEILSMKEAGVDVDIVEDGDTFAANALIKAKAVWEKTGGIVLADDSGLVIDALNGEPGVYSARYMGEKTSYEIKNWNLIHRLDGVPEEKRTARFVCVIAAVLPDGRTLTAEGTMEGVIAHEPAGAGGFGYDPILMLPEYGKTSAEITMDEKNAISHRGKALRAMKKCLAEEIGEPMKLASAYSNFILLENAYWIDCNSAFYLEKTLFYADQCFAEQTAEQEQDISFWSELGDIYRDCEQFSRAMACYQKERELFQVQMQEEPMEESTKLVQFQTAVAVCNLKMKQFSEMEENYEEAIALANQLYGEEHEETGEIWATYACALIDWYNAQPSRELLKKCKAAMEQALEILLEHDVYGEVRIANLMMRYSSVLSELGEFQNCDIVAAEALECFQKNFGELHEQMEWAYLMVGDNYHKAGDKENAKRYYDLAIRVLRENDYETDELEERVEEILQGM